MANSPLLTMPLLNMNLSTFLMSLGPLRYPQYELGFYSIVDAQVLYLLDVLTGLTINFRKGSWDNNGGMHEANKLTILNVSSGNIPNINDKLLKACANVWGFWGFDEVGFPEDDWNPNGSINVNDGLVYFYCTNKIESLIMRDIVDYTSSVELGNLKDYIVVNRLWIDSLKSPVNNAMIGIPLFHNRNVCDRFVVMNMWHHQSGGFYNSYSVPFYIYQGTVMPNTVFPNSSNALELANFNSFTAADAGTNSAYNYLLGQSNKIPIFRGPNGNTLSNLFARSGKDIPPFSIDNRILSLWPTFFDKLIFTPSNNSFNYSLRQLMNSQTYRNNYNNSNYQITIKYENRILAYVPPSSRRTVWCGDFHTRFFQFLRQYIRDAGKYNKNLRWEDRPLTRR